jgi:hypothetical protein
MKTFKFKSLCRKVGFQKQEGYSAFEIISLMLMLPLMLLKSVHALYRSEFQKVTDMKKDAIYRLKNNENMPWRSLLLNVAKTFVKQINPDKEIAANSAFILDDTVEEKTGRRIEQISYIHNHVAGKKGNKLGFKNLTLGLFDGKSFLPLDFSLHSEKLLKAKYRKQQYQKQRDSKSPGAKRMKECSFDKISNGLQMLKRAVKHGFRAKYLLTDSWFSSKAFIETTRSLAGKEMHVICGVRKEKRYYCYNGENLNAKQLLATLKKRTQGKTLSQTQHPLLRGRCEL